ncbi:MAG: Rrf2 family transcriptional regulator [Acidimicrobiia bacterium]
MATRGSPVANAEIARDNDLPAKFLADLRRAGLVHAKRGGRGGFRLARSADAITVADVVQVLAAGPAVFLHTTPIEALWASLDNAILRGHVARARSLLTEAATRLELSDPRAVRPVCLALLAIAEAQGGEPDRAADRSTQAETAMAACPTSALTVFEFRRAVTWHAGASGELTRAAQLLGDLAVDCGEDVVNEATARHEKLRLGGPTAVDADRLRARLDHRQRPRPRLRRPRHSALAPQCRRAGFDGRHLRRHRCRPLAAEAAVAAADAYKRAGHPDTARRLSARARRLLAPCDGLRPIAAPSADAGLSRLELEIARLAATG